MAHVAVELASRGERSCPILMCSTLSRVRLRCKVSSHNYLFVSVRTFPALRVTIVIEIMIGRPI